MQEQLRSKLSETEAMQSRALGADGQPTELHELRWRLRDERVGRVRLERELGRCVQ